jgi:steroid delta-isomerase-like uncharacterized protein
MTGTAATLARRFIEEVLSGGRLEAFAELTAPDYADHSLPPGLTPEASIAAFRAGFPDASFEVGDVVAGDHMASARWSVTGTHTGEFFGVPATGRPVRMQGISMYRVRDGRLAEAWVQYDQLGLLQQIGALPAPGASPQPAQSG